MYKRQIDIENQVRQPSPLSLLSKKNIESDDSVVFAPRFAEPCLSASLRVQGHSSDLEQISLNMTNRQKYTVDGIHFFSTQQVTLLSIHRTW